MNHLTGRKVPHLFEFIMLMKLPGTTDSRHVDVKLDLVVLGEEKVRQTYGCSQTSADETEFLSM